MTMINIIFLIFWGKNMILVSIYNTLYLLLKSLFAFVETNVSLQNVFTAILFT